MEFSQVWGVDQTGAAQGKMKAKALPAAFISLQKNGLYLKHNLHLPSLEPQHLIAHGWNIQDKSLLFLDSVLGLPQEVSTSFSPLIFRKAYQHLLEQKKYGALTADSFFQALLSASQKKELPTRAAEIKAKANSVFKLRPYQRNIGCGTFRIWADLGSGSIWFHLWNQKNTNRYPHKIIEAYPSLLWKKRIQSKRGDEEKLRDWLRRNHIFVGKQPFKSVDHMDAAVLAACGYLHQDLLKRKIPLESALAVQEGWIFDLEK